MLKSEVRFRRAIDFFCKMFAVQIFHLIIICVFCLPFGLDISKIIDGLAFNVYAHGIIGRHKENGYNKKPIFVLHYVLSKR